MELNKRTKESTGQSIIQKGKIGEEFKLTKDPQFIKHRLQVFDRIKEIQQQQKQQFEQVEIQVKLKFYDNAEIKTVQGVSFQTTVLELIKKEFKKQENDILVCRVKYSKKYQNHLEDNIINTGPDAEDMEQDQVKQEDWELYDLTRQLEGDCEIELLDWEHPLGKMVFWHSSAHVLGESLEQNFGCHLCIGPPLQSGFYYDAYMGDHKIQPENYKEIEEKAYKNIKEAQRFERIVLSKQEALEMFKDNPFKLQLIQNKIQENGKTTAYKCGDLIDLCTGPHILNTGKIKAIQILKNSGSYWMGNAKNDNLQRVYGISFMQEKQMKEYNRIQEELAKYDHRIIAKQQELFFFSQLSPGCAFFNPSGAIIYQKLINIIREQYLIRGYKEVITPNMFNINLWKTSGHYGKYNANMFFVKIREEVKNSGDKNEVVEEIHGLKPMNCPAHCIMFDSQLRSYRDLPLRMADFGVLHRNELTGALSGLTRVRRFQQDDAHIFARPDQIQSEILAVLQFVDYIYNLFGFTYKFELSTRPEISIGDDQMWEDAENALQQALDQFGKPYKINPGDGAFYGPKIDCKLLDTMKREHQCGTIQLDFNFPLRFNLQYRTEENDNEGKNKKQVENKKVQDIVIEDNKLVIEDKEKKEENHLKNGFARPIIIHRAVLGSVERFMAICCEHFKGKWPFMISAKQVIVLPISEKFSEYAEKVYNRLKLEGLNCDLDNSSNTLNKKIRNAQNDQYNYIAVVGADEMDHGEVDVRDRDKQGDNNRIGKFKVDSFVQFLMERAKSNAQILQHQSLINNAFFNLPSELDNLNNELKLKVFFGNDGFQKGERDQEMYEKLKEVQIYADKHPNLYRWKEFMQKV